MTVAAHTPAVTVVIPAYNAAKTAAATIESVLAQTCGDIEVLFVDDGSTDKTCEIVDAYARKDGRLRLLRQANGGVARARNRGIEAALGRYIAPLDADDLWHPLKLERQLRAAARGDPGVGLIYCWSRDIDEEDAVTLSGPQPKLEGDVLMQHLAWNFIGNGSTPLVAAGLLKQIRYEPALRDASAQGCEDYLMQLRVANCARFACAPGFLVGYRNYAGSMSSDHLQMARSAMLAFESLRPGLASEAQKLAMMRRCEFETAAAASVFKQGGYWSAATYLGQALRADPRGPARWFCGRMLPSHPRRQNPEGQRRDRTRRDFFKLSPDEANDSGGPPRGATIGCKPTPPVEDRSLSRVLIAGG